MTNELTQMEQRKLGNAITLHAMYSGVAKNTRTWIYTLLFDSIHVIGIGNSPTCHPMHLVLEYGKVFEYEGVVSRILRPVPDNLVELIMCKFNNTELNKASFSFVF